MTFGLAIFSILCSGLDIPIYGDADKYKRFWGLGIYSDFASIIPLFNNIGININKPSINPTITEEEPQIVIKRKSDGKFYIKVFYETGNYDAKKFTHISLGKLFELVKYLEHRKIGFYDIFGNMYIPI